MPICTRPGCGADFSSPAPCTYHPGSPVFHEGLKSWSCCNTTTNKPVLEFDQFMQLRGCTEENSHSDVKPVKKETSKREENAKATTTTTKPAATAADVTPLSGAALASAQALKQQQQASKSSTPAPPKPEVEEEDPADVDEKLSEGQECKRTACSVKFAGGKRDRTQEECRYHKGSAIFHEGSKGYTCCKRRVLDFADFLTIEPCTLSTHGHLFVGQPKKPKAGEEADDGVERVECRMDHYETPSQVHVTVYAKGVDREKSTIEFAENEVRLNLSLPASPSGQARAFQRTLLPFALIDAAGSTFNLTKFKLEMVLQKAVKGQSWLTLESGEKAFGYGQTFGRQ